MRILTSPLHYVKKKRARRRQVRTVLHMLSVSGVIRPSHIEPRYFEPASQLDALYRQEVKRSSSASLSETSLACQSSGFDWMKVRQLILTIRPSRLQIEQ
jgi:hypothetical protein